MDITSSNTMLQMQCLGSNWDQWILDSHNHAIRSALPHQHFDYKVLLLIIGLILFCLHLISSMFLGLCISSMENLQQSLQIQKCGIWCNSSICCT